MSAEKRFSGKSHESDAQTAARQGLRWHREGPGAYASTAGQIMRGAGFDWWFFPRDDSLCGPFPTLSAAKAYAEEDDVAS